MLGICIYMRITTLHKYTVVVKSKYEAQRHLWYLEEKDCDEVKRETAVKKYKQHLRRVLLAMCISLATFVVNCSYIPIEVR